jgi:hypothetical protein
MKKILLAILFVAMLSSSVNAGGDWDGHGDGWGDGWHDGKWSSHYEGCGHSFTFTPTTHESTTTTQKSTTTTLHDNEIPEYPTAALPGLIAAGGYLLIRRKRLS